MKYLIIGAGGTGGAIGGFLARAGKDVTFIDKGAHLEKIKTSGLYLETPNGEYMISAPACAMDEYSDVPDVIFVCVKGYSLDEVLPFIERVADAHTVVIPILGIYGTYSKIQEKIPGVIVADGCVYITSEIEEPGSVRMSGRIFRVIFGLPKSINGNAAERAMAVLEKVRQDLRESGIMSVLSSRIEIDTLQKFSYVSPMAAVGAGYDVAAWSIQVPGELQNIFKSLVKEVKWLSDAMECSLPEDIVDINLAMMKNQPPETITSMHRDILEGKESELDGLVFEVVRMGEKFGVDVPTYREIANRFPGVVHDAVNEAAEEAVEVEAAEEAVAVEEPEVVEEPEEVVEVEEPVVVEEPVIAEEPEEMVEVEEPVVVESAEEAAEEVIAVEESEVVESAEEAVVVEEPAVPEEAVVVEEPTVVEAAKEAIAVEEPVVAEETSEDDGIAFERAVDAVENDVKVLSTEGGIEFEAAVEAEDIVKSVAMAETLKEDEGIEFEVPVEEAESEEVAQEAEEAVEPEEVVEEVAQEPEEETVERLGEEAIESEEVTEETAEVEESTEAVVEAEAEFEEVVEEAELEEVAKAVEIEEVVEEVEPEEVAEEVEEAAEPEEVVEETESEEVTEEAEEAAEPEEVVEEVAQEPEEETVERLGEEAIESEEVTEETAEVEESTEAVVEAETESEEVAEEAESEEVAEEVVEEAEPEEVVEAAEPEEVVEEAEPEEVTEEPEDAFVVEEITEDSDDDFFEWEEVEIIEGAEEVVEEVTEECTEEFAPENTAEQAEEPVEEELSEEDAFAAYLEEEADGEPRVHIFDDGSKFWKKTYDKFEAKVFLPKSDPITDIVNFGFMTPYLLVFEEERRTPLEAKAFAEESGLAEIAAGYGGSVVAVYPTNEGGWSEATEDLFTSLISNTKISQYYHDGMAVMRNRFTGEWGESYIRGALLRSYLYGYGKSADYIAQNLLKTVEGDGLYGKGDITPVICVLENLSVIPQPERRDIPVVSVGNSEEINEALTAGLDAVLIKEQAEYVNDFYSFMKKYRRMVGYLDEEPNLEEMGVEVEVDYCVVPTAPDNRGDDADTTEHKIGYVAYYNRGIMNKEEVPLVLCFHGGGDSAMCMVALSDWHRVVAQNDFLLVSVENHLNSTATEAMHLLTHLKSKYSIDTERIYATGFSMGGCKSWDLFQEYPYVFAALAPMDATFDVGQNVYGQPVENINREIPVPVFYVGGEQTPLPELPFQAQKCTDRMAYVLEVNKSKTKYDVKYEERANWENPIWGIDGDVICRDKDDNRGSVLTMHLFESENGCCYSVFGSGSPQQHEMRYLNCKNAWKFFKQFRRLPNGELVGGAMDDVINAFNEE